MQLHVLKSDLTLWGVFMTHVIMFTLLHVTDTVTHLILSYNPTSKCMHGMNQTEAEYSRHGKRSQRASLSQIGPVVLEV